MKNHTSFDAAMHRESVGFVNGMKHAEGVIRLLAQVVGDGQELARSARNVFLTGDHDYWQGFCHVLQRHLERRG